MPATPLRPGRPSSEMMAQERFLLVTPIGGGAATIIDPEGRADADAEPPDTMGAGVATGVVSVAEEGEDEEGEEEEEEEEPEPDPRTMAPVDVMVRNMLVSSATIANLEYQSLLSWLVGKRSFALTEMRRARWRSSAICCWRVGARDLPQPPKRPPPICMNAGG